jgi:hypothetical protein
VGFGLLGGALVLGVLAGIKGYRLADAMRLSAPLAWATGLFLPCISVALLLALSSKATHFCRTYGLRVRLLGPAADSIDAFAKTYLRG